MDSQLKDILLLVSRTAEKGGDLHAFIHGDSEQAAEVYAFIDSLRLVSQLPVPPAQLTATARARKRLVAELTREVDVTPVVRGLLAKLRERVVDFGSLVTDGLVHRPASR